MFSKKLSTAVAVVALTVCAASISVGAEVKPSGGEWECPGYGMMGPGMMGYGMGPGMMMGRGMMGYGMGPGMMGNGDEATPGYGMGYGMGPGMMGQGRAMTGRGQGMMGQGMPGGGAAFSVDGVKAMMERRLEWSGNPNIKLGKVEEKDDTMTAEIVTKDGSLVQRFVFDRKTGGMRRAN
jgi:hypothetical protein